MIRIILYLLAGVGILFSLPSTMYLAVFKGIFGRAKPRDASLALWCRGDAALEARYQAALERYRQLSYTDVYIHSFDGLRLHARHIAKGSDRLAILAHGYRTPPELNFALQMQDFLAEGYDLLVIDHRAHGESEGRLGSMGYLEHKDLLAWIDWAAYDQVVVYGMSMGCAAVGYAAGSIPEGKVRALIMDCGFSNFYDELNYKCDLWKMPKAGFANAENLIARLLLRVNLKWNTMDSLKKCTVPVFFIHGTADDEVLIQEMDKQYDACAGEKAYVRVPDAVHALAYAAAGDAIRQSMFAFVNRFVNETQSIRREVR